MHAGLFLLAADFFAFAALVGFDREGVLERELGE